MSHDSRPIFSFIYILYHIIRVSKNHAMHSFTQARVGSCELSSTQSKHDMGATPTHNTFLPAVCNFVRQEVLQLGTCQISGSSGFQELQHEATYILPPRNLTSHFTTSPPLLFVLFVCLESFVGPRLFAEPGCF